MKRRLSAVFPTAVMSSAEKFATCDDSNVCSARNNSAYATVLRAPTAPNVTNCLMMPRDAGWVVGNGRLNSFRIRSNGSLPRKNDLFSRAIPFRSSTAVDPMCTVESG